MQDSPIDRQAFDRRALIAGAGLLGAAAVASRAGAGSLTPPGAPSPTMKTLQQVEPRIPINQATAPGDPGSLHVITKPGIYYLEDDIVGVAGKQGIVIDSDNVWIDCRGFAIRGAPGAIHGVLMPNFLRNIHIWHGRVEQWPGDGLQLRIDGGRITGIHAYNNGGSGIANDSGSQHTWIEECLAFGNSAVGIRGGGYCTVRHCVGRDNGGQGLLLGAFCRVEACHLIANTGIGVVTSDKSAVTDCVVTANRTGGIYTFARCYVARNSCVENTGANPSAVNIRSSFDGSRIEENHCVGSVFGIQVQSGGNLIVRNACAANGTDYDIAAGNAFGPIAPVGGVGDISIVPPAGHPWANFAY